MDKRLGCILFHHSLHGFLSARGTGIAVIEAKLAQQLAYLEAEAFYVIFIDLRKAFDAMDQERCLRLLKGYGVGPKMRRLIKSFGTMHFLCAGPRGNTGSPSGLNME